MRSSFPRWIDWYNKPENKKLPMNEAKRKYNLEVQKHQQKVNFWNYQAIPKQ